VILAANSYIHNIRIDRYVQLTIYSLYRIRKEIE